jgi:hypothetical protein
MRKLLTFMIATIFSISVSASSFGGSITLLGVGGPSSASTPFSNYCRRHVVHFHVSKHRNNRSYAHRCCWHWAWCTSGISNATIGGTNAAQVSGAAKTSTNGSLTDIWTLAVPTGTTATIVVTTSATQARVAIEVYSVVGTAAFVAAGGGNASASNVLSLSTAGMSVPAGGGAIAIVAAHSASLTFTPANLTNDPAGTTAGSSTYMGAHNSTSSGVTTMGEAWSPAADAAMSTFNP